MTRQKPTGFRLRRPRNDSFFGKRERGCRPEVRPRRTRLGRGQRYITAAALRGSPRSSVQARRERAAAARILRSVAATGGPPTRLPAAARYRKEQDFDFCNGPAASHSTERATCCPEGQRYMPSAARRERRVAGVSAAGYCGGRPCRGFGRWGARLRGRARRDCRSSRARR